MILNVGLFTQHTQYTMIVQVVRKRNVTLYIYIHTYRYASIYIYIYIYRICYLFFTDMLSELTENKDKHFNMYYVSAQGIAELVINIR